LARTDHRLTEPIREWRAVAERRQARARGRAEGPPFCTIIPVPAGQWREDRWLACSSE